MADGEVSANDAQNAKRPPLGVPVAEFIPNVDTYMKTPGRETTEKVLQCMEEMHQKYKLIENSLMQRRARLRSKLDDLKQSLRLIAALKQRQEGGKDAQTLFMLSDQCYATADIPPTDKVCLWLGANVMVEYSIEEADNFLSKELSSCEEKFNELRASLDYVKDQLTTTEVNMARVYNWDVQKRKKAAGGGGGSTSSATSSA